jgi:predicted DNA-binding transcriptional regulator YafY
VRVSAELALYASERAWHPSQRAKRLPDGGVELCFEVSGLEEVASWILGFRGAATAVAPQELRTMVREAGKQIADKHAEPTKETPPARAGMATEKQKQRARG